MLLTQLFAIPGWWMGSWKKLGKVNWYSRCPTVPVAQGSEFIATISSRTGWQRWVPTQCAAIAYWWYFKSISISVRTPINNRYVLGRKKTIFLPDVTYEYDWIAYKSTSCKVEYLLFWKGTITVSTLPYNKSEWLLRDEYFRNKLNMMKGFDVLWFYRHIITAKSVHLHTSLKVIGW